MKLNILFVEDNDDDLKQHMRLLPDYFKKNGIEAVIDPRTSFDEAFEIIRNSFIRYDLIISDTYKGAHKDKNAAALTIVENFREGKFCPIILYSSGDKPIDLEESEFVKWVDKSNNELENVIKQVLDLGIPQIARKLHDELDYSAGSYLWDFLEKNMENIFKAEGIDKQVILERIIRKRAAIQISDLNIEERHASEYYLYPNDAKRFNLGDIIQKKNNLDEYRVILTPHCSLNAENWGQPKANYILTIKTIPVATVLGEKLDNAKTSKKIGKLKLWSRSPAQTERQPEGRHWYLPAFLKIPHLFCDFLQSESIQYTVLYNDYERIATLLPPYAEALQQCFSSFYGSVGIPVLDTDSIRDLLE